MKFDSPAFNTVRRISLTPLIDIVFILLIFFVLETSFLQIRELGLNLSVSRSAGEVSSRPIDLQLMEDGRIWIQGRSLTVETLSGFLEQQQERQQLSDDTSVFISASDEVSLQLIVSVMDQLQQKGISRIRIGSLEED